MCEDTNKEGSDMRFEYTFRRPEHRLIPVLLAAILVLLLPSGCAGASNRPSAAVAAYLDTVVAMDREAGNAFLKSPLPEGDLFLSGSTTRLPSSEAEYETQIREALSAIYSRITYTVKGSVITGDTAVTSVDVTAPSLITLEEDLSDLAFSGAYADPVEMDAAIATLLLETLQSAAAGNSGDIIYSVHLDMVKEDGVWKIQNSKELGHAIVGNIHGLIIPGADSGTFG